MTYNGLYMNKRQKSVYEKYSQIDYLKKNKLKTIEVDNGIILPAKKDTSPNPKLWAIGGVESSDGKFIDESCSRSLFGGDYEYDEELIENINEEVIFMGPFIKHWGHFLCDQINRLWYAAQNKNKYKVAYCGWNWGTGNTDITDNFLEVLEYIGIERDMLINVQRPTRFKKVIIPEISFIPGDFYTKEFQLIIDTILKNVKLDDAVPKKVYFTREALGSNKEIGEEKISSYLSNMGYEIISPEKLTFKEQISIFNNSSEIAMMSGSIAHNIMFSQNNNTKIIILNKTDMINDYQMAIDHITKSPVTYIDIYKNVKKVLFGMGPFLIYVTKYLESFYNTNINQKTTRKEIKLFRRKYKMIYSNINNKKLLKRQNKSIQFRKKEIKKI